ncbi:hypothetical protein BGAL_0752g00040 [Botrytis galanthina]|uniref:Uncharacterized protein n=1 Tax=Botrytis galanthina TaxID=278940 RepID=A0A4S8QHP5_9HELO|nr:hypothetical protein BGAL_0752g00040 [Botrytis galanthina]
MASSGELRPPILDINNEIDALDAYFSSKPDAHFTSTTTSTSASNATTNKSWFSILNNTATYIIILVISIICMLLPGILQFPLLFIKKNTVNSYRIKYTSLLVIVFLFLVLFTHILAPFMLVYRLLIALIALTMGVSNNISCLSNPIDCMRSSTPTLFGLGDRTNLFTGSSDNPTDTNRIDDQTWINMSNEDHLFSVWSTTLNTSLFTAREISPNPSSQSYTANSQSLIPMAVLLKDQQTIRNTVLAMSKRDTVKDMSIKPILPHFTRVQESMTSLVDGYRNFRDTWVHNVQEIERSTLYLTDELLTMVSSGREVLNLWTQCTYHHKCASSITFFGKENKNAECFRIRGIRHDMNYLRRDYITTMAAEARVLGDRGASLLKEADDLSSSIRAVLISHNRAQSKKSQRLHAIEKESGNAHFKYNDYIFDREGKKGRDFQNNVLSGDLNVLAGLESVAQKLKERVDGDRNVWESVIVECEKFVGGWIVVRSGEGGVNGNKKGADGNVLTQEKSEEVKNFFDMVEKWAEQRLSFANDLMAIGKDL